MFLRRHLGRRVLRSSYRRMAYINTLHSVLRVHRSVAHSEMTEACLLPLR